MRRVLFLGAAVAVSLWYISVLRTFLAPFFEWDMRLECWTFSLVQWGLVIIYGLLERDIVKAWAMMGVWEYGGLFLANGNSSFDLYPLLDVTLASGVMGQVAAFGYALTCLTILRHRKRIVNFAYQNFLNGVN